MLEKLIVDNYLLIDHIEFDGYEGMSVFVGETGSGKSLFIESLGIILGNKFSFTHIGTFRETTTMSAVFSISESDTQVNKWLAKNQYTAGEEIIITRTFQVSGKSITRLNGEIVPVQVIKQLGEMLVDIHSQFDTQQLLKKSAQQRVIDERINQKLKDAYMNAFKAYQAAKSEYEVFESEQNKQQDLDYLHFQEKELRLYQSYSSDIINEKEQIYKQLKVDAQNSRYVEQSIGLIGEDGIRVVLEKLQKNLQYIDSEENQFLQLYHDLVGQLDEIDYRLNQMYENTSDLSQFEALEKELNTIYKLQQKHSENLAVSYQAIIKQIQWIEEADVHRQKLQAEVDDAYKKAVFFAEELERERKQIIQQIEGNIAYYLKKLHLDTIHFKVDQQFSDVLTKSGFSIVEFQVTSNNQREYQPLSKVVSGGELSRIMLALKVVMLETKKMVMIFDEIDSGVSGKVATSIADVLNTLAHKNQVFLITHSALVAVSGKHFYEISKQIRSDHQYETSITKVKSTDVDHLLAQLISQQIPSKAAIEQIQYLRKKYE